MTDEKHLRVLVIDDDDEVREVLVSMFDELGCTAVPAGDSSQAIARFLAEPFDLITLDYRMPGLDGAALHKILSEEFGAGKRTSGFTPKTLPPIAMITGHPEAPEVVSARFGESIVKVLCKPVGLKDIRELIETLRSTQSEDADQPPSAQ
jgi:CheY-like chemotaxis protein